MAGLYVMAEQTANPDSRITLGKKKDALGMRQVHLDWRFTELDIAALERGMELFGHELGRTSEGRLRIVRGGPSVLDRLNFSRHHLGATRMAASAEDGVVDADCRVHGVANLHVAGSSVFPTSGIANPTLTLVALTHRLADHLRTELTV